MNKTKYNAQMKKWAETRKKGKWIFIFKFGVLNWGVVTAILFSLLMHLIDPEPKIWLRPLISLVVFPLGGIFFGLWLWWSSEKNYKGFVQRQGNT